VAAAFCGSVTIPEIVPVPCCADSVAANTAAPIRSVRTGPIFFPSIMPLNRFANQAWPCSKTTAPSPLSFHIARVEASKIFQVSLATASAPKPPGHSPAQRRWQALWYRRPAPRSMRQLQTEVRRIHAKIERAETKFPPAECTRRRTLEPRSLPRCCRIFLLYYVRVVK